MNPAVQQQLAAEGRAVGQCSSCGSYRLDGRPPILHDPGCPAYGVLPAWSLPGAEPVPVPAPGESNPESC
jgi:hypothetical protein